MEVTVLGVGGDEIIIMPFFSPVGRLVSHQLVPFFLLVCLLNLFILPFLSLLEFTIFNIISRRKGGVRNNS